MLAAGPTSGNKPSLAQAIGAGVGARLTLGAAIGFIIGKIVGRPWLGTAIGVTAAALPFVMEKRGA